MSGTSIQVHLRLDFLMEANNMNPREQSDLSPFLQYFLPLNISQLKEQMTKVVTA